MTKKYSPHHISCRDCERCKRVALTNLLEFELLPGAIGEIAPQVLVS